MPVNGNSTRLRSGSQGVINKGTQQVLFHIAQCPFEMVPRHRPRRRLWRIRVIAAARWRYHCRRPWRSPTSARASAGASLIPSPTIATRRPACCNFSMAAALPSGSTPAITSSIPLLAIAPGGYFCCPRSASPDGNPVCADAPAH